MNIEQNTEYENEKFEQQDNLTMQRQSETQPMQNLNELLRQLRSNTQMYFWCLIFSLLFNFILIVFAVNASILLPLISPMYNGLLFFIVFNVLLSIIIVSLEIFRSQLNLKRNYKAYFPFVAVYEVVTVLISLIFWFTLK